MGKKKPADSTTKEGYPLAGKKPATTTPTRTVVIVPAGRKTSTGVVPTTTTGSTKKPASAPVPTVGTTTKKPTTRRPFQPFRPLANLRQGITVTPANESTQWYFGKKWGLPKISFGRAPQAPAELPPPAGEPQPIPQADLPPTSDTTETGDMTGVVEGFGEGELTYPTSLEEVQAMGEGWLTRVNAARSYVDQLSKSGSLDSTVPIQQSGESQQAYDVRVTKWYEQNILPRVQDDAAFESSWMGQWARDNPAYAAMARIFWDELQKQSETTEDTAEQQRAVAAQYATDEETRAADLETDINDAFTGVNERIDTAATESLADPSLAAAESLFGKIGTQAEADFDQVRGDAEEAKATANRMYNDAVGRFGDLKNTMMQLGKDARLWLDNNMQQALSMLKDNTAKLVSSASRGIDRKVQSGLRESRALAQRLGIKADTPQSRLLDNEVLRDGREQLGDLVMQTWNTYETLATQTVTNYGQVGAQLMSSLTNGLGAAMGYGMESVGSTARGLMETELGAAELSGRAAASKAAAMGAAATGLTGIASIRNGIRTWAVEEKDNMAIRKAGMELAASELAAQGQRYVAALAMGVATEPFVSSLPFFAALDEIKFRDERAENQDMLNAVNAFVSLANLCMAWSGKGPYQQPEQPSGWESALGMGVGLGGDLGSAAIISSAIPGAHF